MDRGLGISIVFSAKVAQLIELIAHEIYPQLEHAARDLAILADAADELILCTRVRGIKEIIIDQLIEITDWIGLHVSTGPIQVPNRPENELTGIIQHVLDIKEQALGVVNFLIADELAEHHVACHVVDIHIIGQVLPIGDRTVKGVETRLDGAQREECLVLAKLGMLDVDRNVAGRGAEFLLLGLIIVQVQFQHGGYRLVEHFHTVVRNAHLLGEIIIPLIGSVDVQVNRDDVVGGRCADEACCLHADGIGQHRARHFVGNQHPILAISQSQRFSLAGKLETVGILSGGIRRPRGVTPALDLHRVGHRGVNASTINDNLSIEVILLARDVLAAHGVDIDAGDSRAVVGQEIDIDSILLAIGHHAISPIN